MNRRAGSSLLTLVCLGALVSACAAEPEIPQPRLPVTAACFVTQAKTVPVVLELARKFSERQRGLMGRTGMAEDEGMLFQYDRAQSPDHGFWMYQTKLRLDIAYLGEDGTIGSIRKMAPCSSSNRGNCPTYPAGVPFTSAVEMNWDFFSAHDIAVGDRLRLGKENCPGA